MFYRSLFGRNKRLWGTHRAGVNGQAVVLVLDNSVTDGHAVTLADIKGIRVVAAIVITVRVVDVDTIQDDVVGLDAKGLHGRVLDIEAGNGRVVQVVGIEELGLGLTPVGTLAIPPARTAAVDGVVGCSADDNVRSSDTDKRAFPLLVSKGGFAVEDDLLPKLDSVPGYNGLESHLGPVLEVRKVQRLTSRHLDIVQHDRGARLLTLAGLGSRREGAGGGSLNLT